MEWTDQHIDTVRQAQFPRQRGGYSEDDVDTFLEHVVACMRAGLQIPDPVLTAFPATPLRQGYDRQRVDGLLFVLGAWHEDYLHRRRFESEPKPPPPPLEPMRIVWSQRQLDWVREVVLPKAGRGRIGYDETDVDDFLDAVLVAMGHGKPLPDIESARFNRAGRIRPGYDAETVDIFLDQLMRMRPEG